MHAKIEAIEYYFPPKMVSNADLKEEFPDYDFDNFENKVGIERRYIVEDETGLDLATKACEKLFLKINKSEIDFILYCTQSPDYYLPTTACILQDRLGLNMSIGALDFNLGCSGFVYGLSLAKSLIASGAARNVLLVTAETYSKFINPKDRSNRAIFGDAAAASLITACEEDFIGEFIFGTDGSGFDKLIVKNGCAKNKFDANAEEIIYGTSNIFTDNDLYMNGPEIFNFTSQFIPQHCLDVVKKNHLEVSEIDQFILHQANAFMLNFMRKKMKVDQERFYIDLKDGGNTVSSTIPIALKRYAQNNTSGHMKNILLSGFGVGLSWAGCIIKINNSL